MHSLFFRFNYFSDLNCSAQRSSLPTDSLTILFSLPPSSATSTKFTVIYIQSTYLYSHLSYLYTYKPFFRFILSRFPLGSPNQPKLLGSQHISLYSGAGTFLTIRFTPSCGIILCVVRPEKDCSGWQHCGCLLVMYCIVGFY